MVELGAQRLVSSGHLRSRAAGNLTATPEGLTRCPFRLGRTCQPKPSF